MTITSSVISRGQAIRPRVVDHKSFGLTLAGAGGTPANSLLLPGVAGRRIILFHIGFSNSDTDSNNIAMQWTASGGAPIDPGVSMDTIFLRETLPTLGVSLRNFIGMECASGINQDLHGWLDAESDGWFVNLGYLYIEVL